MQKISAWLLAGAMLAIGVASGVTSAGAEMKKVKIGTEGAYPPANWINEDGELVGFDVDIAKALCKVANFECEFVVQDWAGIIDGLLAKKYDAIVSSMAITEERKKVVDFTRKYYNSGPYDNTPGKFVARKGADLDIGYDSLAGKVVGVQSATIHEDFLRDNFTGVDVRVYSTVLEAEADLVAGRVDLVMGDSAALLEGFLSTTEGREFEFVGPDYYEPDWHGQGAGIAVRKGDTELREAFNAAIQIIFKDGTYDAISDKYYPSDAEGG